VIKGQLRAPSRQAAADERTSQQMARTMDFLSAELRLDMMVADAARVLRSGAPLAVRIVRPDGRVSSH
jgi:hypothetical protein